MKKETTKNKKDKEYKHKKVHNLIDNPRVFHKLIKRIMKIRTLIKKF